MARRRITSAALVAIPDAIRARFGGVVRAPIDYDDVVKRVET